MSRALEETSQFKRDKKRIKRSGRHDWQTMRQIVKELMNDRALDVKHRDHELSGASPALASATSLQIGCSSMSKLGHLEVVLSGLYERARTVNCFSHP